MQRHAATLAGMTRLLVPGFVALVSWAFVAAWSAGRFPGMSAAVYGVAVLGLFVYLTPTALALLLKRRQAPAIAAVNIFGGWTLLGWVVALAWALVRPAKD